MNKMWKRSLSLFLAIVMVVGVVPMGVFAEEQECAHANVEYTDEAATCIWEGYYAEYCNDCQQYLVEELLDPTGHDFVDGVCTACGEAEEVESEAEETEEDSDEQIPEEEELIETPAIYAVTREENGVVLHGNNIWLDKTREDDLVESVMLFGLKTMVLDAMGIDGDTVYYVNADGKKYDVANFLDLMNAAEELKDVLTGQAALRFQVAKSGKVIKDEYVTLRNIAHLQFSINIPAVNHAGQPDDLKAEIEEAMANAEIVVTHNGDVIDLDSISEDLLTIEYIVPEDVAWPGLTKSVLSDAYIKVTIRDSVSLCSTEEHPYKTTTKSGTAYVRLVDSTPKYTVKFNDPDGVWRQFTVIDGFSLADQGVTSLIPARKYYDFAGWYVTGDETKTIVEDPYTVAMNADAVTSYTALLVPQPGYDMDGNGICDYEQSYDVRYYLDKADAAAGNVNTYAEYNLRHGSDTVVPAKPTRDDMYFVSWLKYTGENGATTGISQYVEGNVSYYAVWAENEGVVVTYVKNFEDGTNADFDLPLNEEGKIDDVDPDGFSHTAWYVKDAEGNKVEWNFNTVVNPDDPAVKPYIKDGVLQLECEVGFDDNNDGKLDGSAEDPIIEFYYQDKDDKGAWVNYHAPQTWYKNSGETVEKAIEDDFTDNRKNDGLFDGWELAVEKDIHEDGNYLQYFYRAKYLPDINNNDVDDNEEKTTIKYDAEKDSIAAAAGEGNAYLKDEGVLTVNTEKDGKTVKMGTVTIPGLQADGTILANTNGETTGNNAVVTKIKAVAEDNYYVAGINFKGEAQTMHEDEDGSCYILLHEVMTANTRMSRSNDGLEVVFKEIKAEFKAAPDAGVLIPGKQYTEADKVNVYKAVVAYPEYADKAKVEVKYVARPADTATVKIDALRKDIENRYGKLGTKMLNEVWPGDTIPVDMDKIVETIDYEPNGMVMTPQQVVDNYILELQDAGFNELVVALGMLERNIKSKVNASANIRPFMYNAEGDSFEETLTVSYEDSRLTINNDDENTYTFKDLADNRTATEIHADSVKNVKVGRYTNASLLAGAYLHEAGNESARVNKDIYLAGDFENCGGRTYKGVPIYFPGDTEHKPAVATFDLNVSKSDLKTFNIEHAIAVPYDQTYDGGPTIELFEGDETDIDTLEYISVVAGLDLNNLDLDLSKNNPYIDMKNVGTKAWIHIPDNLKDLLTYAGIDVSGSRTRSLQEIEDMFKNHRELLEQYNVPGWAIDRLLQVLNKVNAYAAGTVDMEIVFVEREDNVYPTNPGVYANVAITTDPRYNTDFAYGAIMIAPVLALPDRGDVQLKLGDKIENVYVVANDLMPKEMVVTYQGAPVEAPVYYYGMNAEFEVVQGIPGVDGFVAPSEPGVYLVSTLYTKDNNGTMERMGSDAAILVIGLAEIEMDVKTQVIAVDGNAHRPEINVTIPDGNGGTVVKDYAEVGVGLTLISGEVNVDRDGDIGLDDLSANVNIHFPQIVYDMWPSFVEKVNNQGEIDMTGMKLDPDMKTSYITPAVLKDFLEWCKTKNTGRFSEDNLKMTLERLQKLHVPAKYIDDVMNFYNKTLDKLIGYCGDLQTAANKLPDKSLLITFDPAKSSYTEEGIYFYLGVVTDPDYVPYANTGVMVLQKETNILLNTHVPYDGEEHVPSGWDKLEGKNFTLVVDRKNKLVNIVSDPSANAIINEAINELEEVAAEFGLKKEIGDKNWLDGKTVQQLYVQVYENGTTLADLLVDEICGRLQTKLIDNIPSDKVQSEIENLKAEIEERIRNLNTEVLGRLEALDLKYKNVKFELNDSLPVNAGTYEFYTYSGTVTVSRADLVIEPIYVRLKAPVLDKVYDGQAVTNLNIEQTYFSYDYVEGTKREDGEITITTLPADIASNLSVTSTKTIEANGIDVRETPYAITISDVSVTYALDNDNVCTTPDVINGSLKITPRTVTVTTESASKAYGDNDPEFKYTDTGRLDGCKLEIEVIREDKSENVGNYALTVNVKTEDPNYTVELANYSELTINKAVVEITVDNKEIAFDEEAKDFKSTPVIKSGLGAMTEEQIKALIDAMNIRIEKGEAVEGKPGTYKLTVTFHEENPNIHVDFVDGELTITLGDYICWNVDTGKPYKDVNEALREAESGHTVQMLKDATAAINEKNEETIIVYAGTTFDLNGFYVEADNLLSFGVVMDSLADTYNPFAVAGEPLEPSVIEDAIKASITQTVEGETVTEEVDVELTSGGILISNDTTEAWTQLQTTNGGYIPIYDTNTGSYKFYSGKVVAIAARKNGSNGVKFGSRVELDQYEGYAVINASKDASLDYMGEVSWEGVTQFDVKYRFKETSLKEYAKQAYNELALGGERVTFAIVLTVNGLDRIGNAVTFKPMLETNAAYTDTNASTLSYSIS